MVVFGVESRKCVGKTMGTLVIWKKLKKEICPHEGVWSEPLPTQSKKGWLHSSRFGIITFTKGT